jgi:hypothetical protein
MIMLQCLPEIYFQESHTEADLLPLTFPDCKHRKLFYSQSRTPTVLFTNKTKQNKTKITTK